MYINTSIPKCSFPVMKSFNLASSVLIISHFLTGDEFSTNLLFFLLLTTENDRNPVFSDWWGSLTYFEFLHWLLICLAQLRDTPPDWKALVAPLVPGADDEGGKNSYSKRMVTLSLNFLWKDCNSWEILIVWDGLIFDIIRGWFKFRGLDEWCSESSVVVVIQRLG